MALTQRPPATRSQTRITPADPLAESAIVPLGNGKTSYTGTASPIPEEDEGAQDIVMVHVPVLASQRRIVES